MSVEDDRQPIGRRSHASDAVLDVAVVLRPLIDVCPVAAGSAEAAKVNGVGLDSGARELRSDMRIATGVLRHAMHEEHARARCSDRRPPICPQIETVPCANHGDGRARRQ